MERTSEDDFHHDQSSCRRQGKAPWAKKVSLASLVGMSVLFFFPFFEISCAGTPFRMELTGADLAFGRSAARSPTGEEIPQLRPLYALLIIVPVIGVAIVFFAASSNIGQVFAGILSILAAIFLSFLLFLANTDMGTVIKGTIRNNPELHGLIMYQFCIPYVLYGACCGVLAIGGFMLCMLAAEG